MRNSNCIILQVFSSVAHPSCFLYFKHHPSYILSLKCNSAMMWLNTKHTNHAYVLKHPFSIGILCRLHIFFYLNHTNVTKTVSVANEGACYRTIVKDRILHIFSRACCITDRFHHWPIGQWKETMNGEAWVLQLTSYGQNDMTSMPWPMLLTWPL